MFVFKLAEILTSVYCMFTKNEKSLLLFHNTDFMYWKFTKIRPEF